jgi:trans-aconitate methyltransferase
MSRPSADLLRSKFAANDHFRVIFDKDGTLSDLGEETFSIIFCASVLHHIPDYLSFIDDVVKHHLAPGGIFLAIQDPLWYPGLRPWIRLLSRWAYLSWRLTQGNYRKGLKTLSRRVRGVYDEEEPGDMVEYHAVRQGLDQDAILRVLGPKFDACSLIPYWSSQGSAWQWLGEKLGIRNTFAIVARGFVREEVT